MVVLHWEKEPRIRSVVALWLKTKRKRLTKKIIVFYLLACAFVAVCVCVCVRERVGRGRCACLFAGDSVDWEYAVKGLSHEHLSVLCLLHAVVNAFVSFVVCVLGSVGARCCMQK